MALKFLSPSRQPSLSCHAQPSFSLETMNVEERPNLACHLYLSVTCVPSQSPGTEALQRVGSLPLLLSMAEVTSNSPPSWSRGLKQCLLRSTCLTPPFSFTPRTSRDPVFSNSSHLPSHEERGQLTNFYIRCQSQKSGQTTLSVDPPQCLGQQQELGAGTSALFLPFLLVQGCGLDGGGEMNPLGPCEEISQVFGAGGGGEDAS